MEFDFDLEDPAYETVKEVTEKVETKEVKKVVEVIKDEPKIVSKEAKVEDAPKVEPVKDEAAPKEAKPEEKKEVNKDTKPKKNLLNIVVKTETPKN